MAKHAFGAFSMVVASGDTASVVVMRLNARHFVVTSVGCTNSGSGRLGAQRQVSVLVSVASGSATVGRVGERGWLQNY